MAGIALSFVCPIPYYSVHLQGKAERSELLWVPAAQETAEKEFWQITFSLIL